MSNSKRRCSLKTCREYRDPATMVIRGPQAWCNDDCMVAWSIVAGRKLRKAKEKSQRSERAAAKAKLKTKGEWLKEAQVAFNAYIRERDKCLPCVSCGNFNNVKMNAGHYRSVGSMPALRFEPLNCWKQCEHCNSYLSGNLIEYRKELLNRIGADNLAWLEGPHEAKHYTIEEIQRMKGQFKIMLKAL